MFAAGEDPISPSGPRDAHLLGSACARPHTAMGGTEKYNSLETKAAALFHSLVKNHPFHNGNKRTALVTLVTCLAENDRRFKPDMTDDGMYQMVTSVAEDAFPEPGRKLSADDIVDELSGWIRRHTAKTNSRPQNMRTSDFIEKVQAAGATAKESGGSYVVSASGRSIRFSRSTRELAGNVIRSYLRKLELSESKTAMPFDEFVDGAAPEQEEIRRFRAVLVRLAHS